MRQDQGFAPVGVILLVGITVAVTGGFIAYISFPDAPDDPVAVGFLVREDARLELVKTGGEELTSEATRVLVGTPKGSASIGVDEIPGMGDIWSNGQAVCLAGEGPRCLQIHGADRIIDVRVVHAHQLVYRWEGQPSISDLLAGSGPLVTVADASPPTADPGHAFEDVDNDGLFSEGIDIQIDDADIADGSYHVTDAWGLVLPASVAPIDADAIHLSAGEDGHVLIATALSATKGILVEAGDGISAEDATFSAQDEDIVLAAGDGDLELDGTTFETDDEHIELSSDGDLSAHGATLTTEHERVVIDVAGSVDLSDAKIAADERISITAGDDVSIEGAILTAGEAVEIQTIAGATVSVEDATIEDGDDTATVSPSQATIEGQPTSGTVAH